MVWQQISARLFVSYEGTMSPLRCAIIVTVTVALITGAVFAWFDANPKSPEQRYEWVLAPAAIGMILAGGVHGGAPIWVILFAMCTSNGACWGIATYGIARLVQSARGRRGKR
jgi:hypothetical protein